jgi:hypothetical protein
MSGFAMAKFFQDSCYDEGSDSGGALKAPPAEILKKADL